MEKTEFSLSCFVRLTSLVHHLVNGEPDTLRYILLGTFKELGLRLEGTDLFFPLDSGYMQSLGLCTNYQGVCLFLLYLLGHLTAFLLVSDNAGRK